MDKFYLLLVKESLNNEDVAGLARDNVKDCHEIEQAFKTRWVAMQDPRLQCFFMFVFTQLNDLYNFVAYERYSRPSTYINIFLPITLLNNS